MNNAIDSQWNLQFDQLTGQCFFARECTRIIRNMIRRDWFAVLYRNLHVIEPGFDKLFERARHDADSGGDEICIQAAGMCCSGNLDKVPACARFPAGEVDLQNPERRRLPEGPSPSLRIKFAASRIKGNRVGAIWTAERATMRQFGEKANRPRGHRLRYSVRRAGALDCKTLIALVLSHQSEFQQAAFGKLSQ
jgi:hypothetical protein